MFEWILQESFTVLCAGRFVSHSMSSLGGHKCFCLIVYCCLLTDRLLLPLDWPSTIASWLTVYCCLLTDRLLLPLDWPSTIASWLTVSHLTDWQSFLLLPSCCVHLPALSDYPVLLSCLLEEAWCNCKSDETKIVLPPFMFYTWNKY